MSRPVLLACICLLPACLPDAAAAQNSTQQSVEFPGFELDVHGLIIEQHASGPLYVVEVRSIGGGEPEATE